MIGRCDLLGHADTVDAEISLLFLGIVFSGLFVHQILDDRDCPVDRDGVAHTFNGVAADLVGVDADDFAGDVAQRAARIAEVDGRVGLNQRSAGGPVFCHDLTVQRTDDAGGHGLAISEGIADCDCGLADFQLVRDAEGGDLNRSLRIICQVIHFNHDHRQIVLGIGSLELRVNCFIINELHLQAVFAFHHVVVGRDQKFFSVVALRDDNAGAGALRILIIRLAPPVAGFGCVIIKDGYNRRQYVFSNFRDIGHHCGRVADFDRCLRFGLFILAVLCQRQSGFIRSLL